MAECPYRFNLPKKQRECIKHECAFYTNVVGKNPQSEETFNQWGCAIAWLPMMLIENSQRVVQSTATTDKVATEINRATQLFATVLQGRLLQADAEKKIGLKEKRHGI